MSDDMPVKGEVIYEGKAKILYATSDPGLVIQYFKDDATAFNAKKTGTIEAKGIINNAFSTKVFRYLEENGVKTHLVKKLSDREQLVRKVEILPVEVVARNRAAGSLARKMGIKEGAEISHPILEFYYKDDALDDPMINADYVTAFQFGTREEIDIIMAEARKINVLLTAFFRKAGIELVDFKLEFGRVNDDIVLADEISPDSCRLWDIKTGEKLDKDRFRFDLGRVEESYREVLNRVTEI